MLKLAPYLNIQNKFTKAMNTKITFASAAIIAISSALELERGLLRRLTLNHVDSQEACDA